MNDHGRKISQAMRAIRQMHSDASRLLQDCDGSVGSGRSSVFGSNATTSLTYGVNATQWMAEGVYRYYDASDVEPGLVESVMVAFIDKEQPDRPEEPLLLCGRIKYRLGEGASVKGRCEGLDMWYAYFDWSHEQSTGKVLTPEPKSADRIEWVKVAAVPLYSVDGMAVVENLMAMVRDDR